MSDACYLIFEPTSGGSLFIVWSKTEVPNWLIKGVPTMPVPAHKFASGGKTLIYKELSGHKANYYSGGATFVKLAAQFKSKITVKDPSTMPVPLSFVLHKSNQEIVKSDNFDTTGVDAWACVPPGLKQFDTKTMDLKMFIHNGNTAGAVIQATPGS